MEIPKQVPCLEHLNGLCSHERSNLTFLFVRESCPTFILDSKELLVYIFLDDISYTLKEED